MPFKSSPGSSFTQTELTSPRRVIEDWSHIRLLVPPVSPRPSLLSDYSFPISPAPEQPRPRPSLPSLVSLVSFPYWTPFPVLPLPVYFLSNTSELLFPDHRPGPACPCISFDASLKIKPRLLCDFCPLQSCTLHYLFYRHVQLMAFGEGACIPEERWMWSNTFVRTSSRDRIDTPTLIQDFSLQPH